MPNQKSIVAGILIILASVTAFAQNNVQIRILKAEDERRWDTDLQQLLASTNPAIRKRAALAAGRIGNQDSVSALAALLHDANADVRAMAAFAIGEVEAASGAEPLLAVLKKTNEPVMVRARAIEALGKIAGALPREQEPRRLELGAAILAALKNETATSDRLTAVLGLTAALRSRPANAGPTIAKFLAHPNARVRADAGNTLARLRLNDGNARLRKLLDTDADPIVRANAARVLGATEDKASFDSILKHAVEDPDSRVRVSAIRSLAALKDARAVSPLLKHGEVLTQQNLANRAAETNEVLEIATTLGRLLALKEDEQVLIWLGKVDEALNSKAPEVAVAMTRMSPTTIIRGVEADAKSLAASRHEVYWEEASTIAAALGEIAALPATAPNKAEMAAIAEATLRGMLLFRLSPEEKTRDFATYKSEITASDILRAFAAFKPNDLAEILIQYLDDPDVIVRGTAADLLGDLPPSEPNTRALAAALPRTEKDPFNDAALSTLDALGKQKSEAANNAISLVLGWRDHLVRRRAVKILKDNGVGDLSIHIGIVQTKNTAADYRRALARIGRRKPRAVVTTTKGSFTMELLPEAAPLTVDNFVQLAQRSFFNGIIIHRVVPNFVIQDGDPRGDGNGGPPNHQIRCEINEVPYDRAVVGMALSGKDTGGSQWFVTHSPQPHLDGGYTVFGRVIAGMNVVDNIIRGDVIKSIVIR